MATSERGGGGMGCVSRRPRKLSKLSRLKMLVVFAVVFAFVGLQPQRILLVEAQTRYSFVDCPYQYTCNLMDLINPTGTTTVIGALQPLTQVP